MSLPFLDLADSDPADGLGRGSLDHPLFDSAAYLMPTSHHTHSRSLYTRNFSTPDYDDPDSDREEDLRRDELASYNDDAARSDEDGWFYSDDGAPNY